VPYPNEHSNRLKNPNKYVRFRRQNNKGGNGIHFIYGITEEGIAELQAIRFDSSKFTVAEAKKWLKDHDYSTSGFEPASGKVKKEDDKKTDFKKVSIGIVNEDEEETNVRSLAKYDIELPIMKVDDEKRWVGGIVYTAGEEEGDAQGDWISDIEELRKASELYMLKSQRIKIMHGGVARGDLHIIENFVTDEPTMHLGVEIPKNSWWLMTKVLNDEIWKDVKEGKLTGFSMGGRARERRRRKE